MDNLIDRQAAIDAVTEALRGLPVVCKDIAEKAIKQLPPANCSEFPNSSDTISRQAAIEALKNDMASLDHIIKGMSANDVRLDAYVSQRNQVNYDIYTINNLPPVQPAQLSTNLAKVGADCISRQAAIKKILGQPPEPHYPSWYAEQIKELPPAEPKMGRWLYCEDSMANSVDGYRCDQCGFFVPWDYQHKGIDFIQDYNFCPNCGAKMEE